ncbi:MAG: DEAD/DEAH box helicase [Myxococcota bacterium]
MSEGVARPGIRHGVYPERNETRKSGAERAFDRVKGWVDADKPDVAGLERFAIEVEDARERLREKSDSALLDLTESLRKALFKEGVDGDLAVPAFALISEQARRTMGMEPYRVQLMGGYAMMRGMLAEMGTGEGKTLTATLPTCCAALAGMPVHVITVNDYLVERDAELMRPLYEKLGLTVGVVLDSDTDTDVRQKAYQADITYVTNKQIAFDYLRDRMERGEGRSKIALELMAKGEGSASPFLLRGLCYAIVDEADSVLIDEAGTPLILSQTVEDGDLERMSREALALSEKLEEKADFEIDLNARRVNLLPEGSERLSELTESMEGIWCAERRREELIVQALQARFLYRPDEEYLVREDKVMIIDRNTGRVMPDRSWEAGLHQMIEAKEGVEISGQRKTLARISYQKFYRRYLRLCGMTGTAEEVRGELRKVYDLDTIAIPTRRPIQRRAEPARVFATSEKKWAYVLDRIKRLHAENRPILVGARSVGESEDLSRRLTEVGLPHDVLNAREDHREAEIIAVAGEPGKITVATSMAGRGTDIKVSDEVKAAGGLHVMSTARGEAGRVDRQLYGRCGRQGDPGSYECVDSLEEEAIETGVSKFLIRVLAPFCDRPQSWGHRAATRLVLSVQRRSEAVAAKQRAAMMQEEESLERTLAFSGQAE